MNTEQQTDAMLVDAMVGAAVVGPLFDGAEYIAEMPGDLGLELWAIGQDADEALFCLRERVAQYVARQAVRFATGALEEQG